MNSRQIESWALRVIDCVNSGQPNEDFLVELKREWIPPNTKAARQIAGHANAARGENILWLMGVDEKQGVIGVDAADLASWYAAVESSFNELAPRMISLNIPADGKTVVALLFETDRAPFVVKNPAYGSSGGGAVELEVPWREKTSTRSARRSDLIQLLAPLELLPEIEILDGSFKTSTQGVSCAGSYIPDQLRLRLELYIVPKNRNCVVIPFHRCKAEVEIPGLPIITSDEVSLFPAGASSEFMEVSRPAECLTIRRTINEVIIDGPGKLSLRVIVRKPSLPEDWKDRDIHISIHLLPTGADRPLVLETTLSCKIEK